MFSANFRSAGKEQGFTLIELLIVILIIGILTAIAIPMFLNQRKAAMDASIESNAKSITNALDAYYVKNNQLPRQGPLTVTSLQRPGVAKSILGLTDAQLTHPKNQDGAHVLLEEHYGPWMRDDVFGYRAFYYTENNTINACWGVDHTYTNAIVTYKLSDGTFQSKMVGNPACRLSANKTYVECG